MDLVTVGTGTVAPSATRTSACHWVSRGRLKILLDCGPGALHRLAQVGLPWPEVTRGGLSHFPPAPRADLARWAAGCDLLLAECSLPEAMAIESHLTPIRAGELARGAGAKQLVLTHFYPPVETSDPAREAGTRFPGPVTAAKDGDRFRIGGR